MQNINNQRIVEMDALRGLALIGILLVNIFVLHAPIAHFGEFYGKFEGFELQIVDAVADYCGGKFLFIFAFLFGYGLQLQGDSRPTTYHAYLPKRMLLLLCIGLIHLIFIWFGDILTSYALLGLLAICFIPLNRHWAFYVGLFFLLFRPIYYLAAYFYEPLRYSLETSITLQDYLNAFQNYSYTELFDIRMQELWWFMPENLVWYIPKSFGLLLWGIYAAKCRFFQKMREHDLKSLRIGLIALLAGVMWNIVKYDFFESFDLEAQPLARPFLIFINVIGEIALAMGYIILFTFCFRKMGFISRAFAKTGRMALTNYLLQSIICVLIFFGYGLGFYGKLKPSDIMIITFSVFAFNMLFSYVYLSFYQMGPMEYIWRRLSEYNRRR